MEEEAVAKVQVVGIRTNSVVGEVVLKKREGTPC